MPLDEDLEDYESTLGDLRTNSKPNINALTLLAEDYRNKDHSLAEGVVRLIETRLQKVVPTQKLPLMYLLDSIVKNVGEPYRAMFTEKIVATFCNTFERVDQTTRAKLYKLRTTWNTLFPVKMLASIDSKIKAMDPSWPLDPQSSQIAAAAAAGGGQLGSQGASSSSIPGGVGGGGGGGIGSNIPTSNNDSAVASTNIHINPRVYPHFETDGYIPLTNQLGSNPAMYYGHPTPAAVSTQNVGSNPANQNESRDPRLRGKTAPAAPATSVTAPNIQQTKTAIMNAPTNVTPALQATNPAAMTTGAVVNTYPYAAVQPMTTADITGTDQSMFPFFAMQAQAAQMPVAGMVSAQMPGGAIVQLTPEQLKAAAAVAPIPGVEPSPVKVPETNTVALGASIVPTTAIVKPMVKRVGVGGKMNKTGEQKKKTPKPQPKRPLSPWRTKRASPPNFMREDRSVSPDRDRDRTSSPSGSERRRADSEGKRKRPSGSAASGSQDQVSDRPAGKDSKSGSMQRGRSSSPGPAKKKNNMTESPKRDKEEKSDEIKYGSNVPTKKNKDSASSASDTEKSDATKKPSESTDKTEPSPTKKVSQPPVRRPLGRAQAEVAAKLLGKRGNNQKSLKPIPPKNPRLSVLANGQNKQKKSAEEGFIPIKDDVQVGKKDVDYRGIRGAATSSSSTAPPTNSTTSPGGQSIRVAGVRKVGAGVPEVITPEQVYARAEMLLKSGKLTSQQCKELEEQIKEVQRRREKDTEKKASTDYDMRRAPGPRPGPHMPGRRPVINPSRWPANHRGPPPPPPTSGDRRFGPPPRSGSGPPLRAPDVRSFRHPPPPHFLANQRGPPPPRGANQIPYKGPPPPNFRGAPRMPPDPRWRNVGPPRFQPNPRDGMPPSREGAAPPLPNMPMRPPQFVMNRPPTAPMPPRPPEFPAPPKPNQTDIPRNLPPTEVYQFGPGYGYSPEWDRYYDQHGLAWPKEMPFDPRFAGAQVQNRPRVPPTSGPPLPGTGPILGAAPRPLEPMNVGPQMTQPGLAPGSATVPLSSGGGPAAPVVPVPEPVSLDESNVDLSSLFNRLIDMGMISSSSTLAEDANDSQSEAGVAVGGGNQPQQPSQSEQGGGGVNEDEDEDESMRFKPPDADTEPLADIGNISFDNESLKEYQFGVIQRMYRGLQCSSCGMRYPIDKQSQYTAHLDWHFRQKKRKADGYVGSSREWFPICEDWFVLSDHADRLSAGFGEESVANEMMRTSANDNVMSNENSVEAEKMSVCADSKIPNDEICKICREYFEQFWHVTAEEWHFLDAIRVEGKTVHFFCYKEFTDSGNDTVIPSTPRTNSMESTSSESNQAARNLNDPNYEPNKTPAKEPNSNSSSAQAVENASSSSSSTNKNDDETAKPQHSLSSLNSILNNLTGDKEASFGEIVAHQSDDDGDCVIRIKEEPKDLSVDSSTTASGQTGEANGSTGSSAEGKGTKESPVLIRIKDEPMDESEMELQVQQHRSR